MTNTNENIDEVLSDVNDQVAKKRKFKKTLISSIILSVVVVICAVVISLASIKIDLRPNFLSGADAYNVYINGTHKRYLDEDSVSYQEFIDTFNASVETTILPAMFSGRLGGYTIEESKTTFYGNSASKTGMSSALKNELGNSYIEFVFNAEQKVTHKDGSQYYSTEYKDGYYALKFQHCYLKLDKEESNTMTFFLGTYDTSNATITKVVVKADSNVLYQYFA